MDRNLLDTHGLTIPDDQAHGKNRVLALIPLSPALSLRERAGVRIPRRDSRFAPLNRPLSGLRHPLPLRGGEGKGEGAVSIASRFRGRGKMACA